MSKCLPGMSCYEALVYKTYPKGCTTTESSPFSLPLSSDNSYYSGANLPYSGVQTEDSITEALQKIDEKLDPEAIVAAFIAAIDNNPDLKTALCAAINGCS